MGPVRPQKSRRVVAVVVSALVIAMGGLLVGSFAWYSGTTASTGNSVAAGTVSLTDDDGGTALFTVSNMAPGGAAQQKCITAQYDGTLGGTVRTHLASASGALAPYLKISIEEGSGGSGSSCSGFTADVTSLSSVNLSTAASTYTSYATGTGSWGVTGAGQTRRYRVSFALDSSAPNGTAGGSATVDVRWEARDTTDTTAERYRDAVLADAPVAYYRLGDSGTTAVDAISAANGTYQGTTFTHPVGIVGSPNTAATFNGTDNYVSLPSLSFNLTAGLTVEAWARYTSSGRYARIIDLGSGQQTNNVALNRYGTGNDLSFTVDRGATQQGVMATGVIDANWHHYAVTQTAAGLTTIYVDGVSVATGTIHLPLTGPRTASYIGRSPWGSDTLFAGSIDDVAVYTSPLSVARVQAHFRAGR